jgi:hypothetical protein
MTLNDIYRKAKADGDTDICRFMRDMRRAGLRMRPYNGRCYWHGPAVSADSVADVMSETRVKCQHDSLGLGVIVYPRQSLSVSV